MIIKYNDFPFLFALVGGSLNRVVSAFLALPFVQLADRVYLPNNLSVDVNPRL